MKSQIHTLLEAASYGTLALCEEQKPYQIPLNFVWMNGTVYFHGRATGKKMRILSQNPSASFSVVKPYALIPSYFSTTEGLACPATHFFASVLIDGKVVVVEDHAEKVHALTALMQKLQPEGGYKPLHEENYHTVITKTAVFKLLPEAMYFKSKLGEKLPKKRFVMVVENLQKRGSALDLETVEAMQKTRRKNGI